MKFLLILSLTCCFLISSSGCGSGGTDFSSPNFQYATDHEGLRDQLFECAAQKFQIYATIKDETSAGAAVPKILALQNVAREIARRGSRLGEPSAEQEAQLRQGLNELMAAAEEDNQRYQALLKSNPQVKKIMRSVEFDF